MKKLLLVLSVVVLLLAACGSDDDSPAPAETSAPANDTSISTRLARDYESLNVAYQTIGNVWEGLASGEQVQCGTYPEAPAPEDISAGDDDALQPLADLLKQAAIELQSAINLWQAECNNPRTTIPPDVIDEGRLSVRAAGDTLREANDLLP